MRQAVDRGVPLHEVDPDANVINDLKKIILPEEVIRPATRSLFSLLPEEGVVRQPLLDAAERADAPAQPAEQPRAERSRVSSTAT